MPFDPPAIDTDVDAVTDRVLDGMTDRMPGWEPIEGSPETALAEELGREIAVLNQSLIDVLKLAVAGIGETTFGFPAYTGVPATVSVEFTVTGPGAIVPSGFTVVGLNENNEEVWFVLPTDLGVPAGTTATATMKASDVGDAGNRVAPGPLTIVTVTTSVVSVRALASSTNGADPEPIDRYLDRFTDYVATLRPGGVKAADLAALARTVPGVHRALGVDLYNPASPGVPSERTATVFCVDETGHPVHPDVSDEVDAVVSAAREVNFIVHVADPTYTRLQIAYTAVVETGADPLVVKAEINVRLADWISSWGSTSSDPQAWVDTPKARFLDAARIAGSAPGVAYLSALTLNGGTADVTLAGPASMPTPLDWPTSPSTITGTMA